MKPYESPMLEVYHFGTKDFMTSSGEPQEVSKNPGHHYLCTVMPNGKPIPENAVGYWGNHEDEP